MPCVCDTIPGNLRGYVVDEDRHPSGLSTRHMHIKRRGARLYRVEWGTDRKGARFVSVQTGKEGDERFASMLTESATMLSFVLYSARLRFRRVQVS